MVGPFFTLFRRNHNENNHSLQPFCTHLGGVTVSSLCKTARLIWWWCYLQFCCFLQSHYFICGYRSWHFSVTHTCDSELCTCWLLSIWSIGRIVTQSHLWQLPFGPGTICTVIIRSALLIGVLQPLVVNTRTNRRNTKLISGSPDITQVVCNNIKPTDQQTPKCYVLYHIKMLQQIVMLWIVMLWKVLHFLSLPFLSACVITSISVWWMDEETAAIYEGNGRKLFYFHPFLSSGNHSHAASVLRKHLSCVIKEENWP